MRRLLVRVLVRWRLRAFVFACVRVRVGYNHELNGNLDLMLFYSVAGGNMNTVKLFLEEKKMDIHARRYEGATVLLDAVQHSGNKTLIEYLISKGAGD